MTHSSESIEQIVKQVPEELQDVVARKLAVVQQIRDLKAENRTLRDEILRSGKINSTALAVSVECW
ncbi:hypothetical protein EV652_12177 [Kribbella steppae]|uniref:Uncharacterized protein n=1 Tax=Kribbella steppae TaxID=2512223 RepID=A0A4R2GXG3_9ACTN|nr:hypothetical protein [Kribbella steppae]TCO15704.1 hypothetical protein EV652_12177 [Kribbella steppae]